MTRRFGIDTAIECGSNSNHDERHADVGERSASGLEAFRFAESGTGRPVILLQIDPERCRDAENLAELEVAVSSVIALFPWMISFTSCMGRPRRAASSVWLIPRAAISSASVSPGGMARSE